MYVLHMCDFRSRAARNLALDNGFLVLFAALRARGRPEIDLDYLFKAKKVTLREDSANRKSPDAKRSQKGRGILDCSTRHSNSENVFFMFPTKSQKLETLLPVVSWYFWGVGITGNRKPPK